MMRETLPVSALLLGALAACSFAPTYKVPTSAPTTAAYEESAGWKPAQPLDDQSRGDWWTLFKMRG